MYIIIYDYFSEYYEEHGIMENFEGSYDELLDYIDDLKLSGCYNIYVTII